MPRTTLDIDGSVLEELRKRARAEDKSMGRLASELLARDLREEPRALPGLRWSRKEMGAPKVDLEDKDALWEALDRERIAEEPA